MAVNQNNQLIVETDTAKLATRAARGFRVDCWDFDNGTKMLQDLYLPQERSLVDVTLSKPLMPTEK